jgi:hypothetical protein
MSRRIGPHCAPPIDPGQVALVLREAVRRARADRWTLLEGLVMSVVEQLEQGKRPALPRATTQRSGDPCEM